MRFQALVLTLATGCDASAAASADLIYEGAAMPLGKRVVIGTESIYLHQEDGIYELAFDGTPRGMVVTQPVVAFDVGGGWIAWSFTVPVDGNFAARVARRTATGDVEEVELELGSSVQALVAAPEGIVIKDSSSGLRLWGTGMPVPLASVPSTTLTTPILADAGFVYAFDSVNGVPSQVMRYALEGALAERLVDGAQNFTASGSRFVYARGGYPNMQIRELDLTSRHDRQLAEIPEGLSALEIGAGHVFAGRYRITEGDAEPFLPHNPDSVLQLDVAGDRLFWSVEHYPEGSDGPTFLIFSHPADGEPPANPTTTNDERPPFL